MSAPVESVLAKARALSAMIAADSGASDGERRNAGVALARLLDRYGLTLDELDSSNRVERTWLVYKRQHANLAAQIAGVVAGDGRHPVMYRKKRVEIPQRGLKLKEVTAWEVSTNLTKAEDEDWRAMLWHYQPLFEAACEELNQRARLANLAKKKALSGFAHKFNLFGPAKEQKKGRGCSMKELAAILAAANAAQGEAWKRPAARLSSERQGQLF